MSDFDARIKSVKKTEKKKTLSEFLSMPKSLYMRHANS